MAYTSTHLSHYRRVQYNKWKNESLHFVRLYINGNEMGWTCGAYG